MRRFKKKPELAFVVLPGVGRISDDRVLEGDQFAKFSPSVLFEVLPAPAPKASAPAVIIPPPPPPPAPAPVLVEPSPARAEVSEVAPVKAESLVERQAPVEKKVEPKRDEKKPPPKPSSSSGKKPSGKK